MRPFQALQLRQFRGGDRGHPPDVLRQRPAATRRQTTLPRAAGSTASGGRRRRRWRPPGQCSRAWSRSSRTPRRGARSQAASAKRQWRGAARAPIIRRPAPAGPAGSGRDRPSNGPLPMQCIYSNQMTTTALLERRLVVRGLLAAATPLLAAALLLRRGCSGRAVFSSRCSPSARPASGFTPRSSPLSGPLCLRWERS